ncbi:MAG: acetylglutamate kinase, partial [Actinobacteria bacterium]|nr:acetylglutamate kinase [Actinomycetota bacterium]
MTDPTSPGAFDPAQEATGKAAVLADALPWMKAFHGATVVIK